MTRFALAFAALAAVLALLPGTPAEAVNAKSWVSNTGNDANDCTLAHPCATLQRAHDQTALGGEIGVLTPGDYCGLPAIGFPCLLIDKSVHITNNGTGEAGILASPHGAGEGITINALAGDIVSLRGLVIDGQGTGDNGITFEVGSALHVQNCVIKNFTGGFSFGLVFVPPGNSQLFVSDSIIVNNGLDAASGGFLISPDRTGSANVVLDGVHVENNVDGLVINGSFSTGAGVHVIVRGSVFSGNAGNGIRAVSAPGKAPAFALVERSSMVNNLQNGLLADGPHATVLLKDNTITRNGAGISAVNGGQLISYGNNTNNNNIGPEGAPTSSLSPM